MPGDIVQRARLILILSAPAMLVLLGLAAGGFISLTTAAVGWAVALAVTAVLVWPLLRALSGLFRYVRHQADPTATPARGFGLIGPSRDISRAVRRLDQAWQQRSGQLRASIQANEFLLDALDDPLVLLTETGVVAKVNAAATQLLGRDLVGRSLAGAIRSPELLEAVDAVRNEGDPQSFTLTLSEPAPRTFSGIAERLGTAAPDGGIILILLHDITAVLRMDRMRADFVANAGHEIRTPLTTLVGMIETLRGPAKDDAEAHEQFLAAMDEHAKRIARLIDDLLSLSRIEMAVHSAPNESVDVADLVRAATKNLDWPASERDVTVVLDLSAELPTLPGDAGELVQAFQNLIDNAIKYGGQGKTVRVTAALTPPGETDQLAAIAVTVNDEGPGVPQEFLGRLTERFFRVDTARSREMGGTGLGLAIVKHVVNRHRGRLEINSTLGEGSRFTIYLPVAPKPGNPDQN